MFVHKTTLMFALVAMTSFAMVGCGDDDDDGGTGTRDSGTPPDSDGGTGNPDTGTPTGDAGPGDAGTPQLPDICVEACAEDEDCTVGTVDTGLTCSAENRCINACAENIECIAQFSGWTTDCDAATPCALGVCVDVNGAGKCALLEPPCTAPLVELTVQDLDAADVMVCGTEATCESGECALPVAETDCNEAGMECPANFVCDTDSGNCLCENDDACPENFTCDTDSGACQCENDDACAGRGVCDTDSGACVCNDATTDCTAATVYDGTTFECGSL